MSVLVNKDSRIIVQGFTVAGFVALVAVLPLTPGSAETTSKTTLAGISTESGAIINVPLFINEGDKIKIETEKGTYKERFKE